jgi:phenylpropionate dioxygenase-like ring-hydroxylating dioxygenase large terminal subunit
MTTGNLLRNYWYAAARSDEVTDAPFARTMLDEPIVLFRRADGRIAALEDRCPHRQAPLSLGRMVDGEIQCNYHGAKFDGGGVCSLIPSQEGKIVPGFAAHAYPAAEADGMIFVWIGDAAKADASRLPDMRAYGPGAGTGVVGGYLYIKANYLLLVDNLLDLTHIAYLHRSTLGATGSEALLAGEMEFEVQGDTVRTVRIMRDQLPTLFAKKTGKFAGQGNLDRFTITNFRAPSYLELQLCNAPASEKLAMCDVPHHRVHHCITPESAGAVHYYWTMAWYHRPDDGALAKEFHEITQRAFDEDLPMLEAQQRNIESDPAARPLVNFEGDRAGAAARRIVANKLAGEDARAAE